MICQNCGRRSSDRKSFCEHCGAVASGDMPEAAAQQPRAARVLNELANRAASRPRRTRQAPARVQQQTSNPIATLIFWGLVASGVYWLMGDSGREIRALLMDLLQQLQ